MKKYIITFVFSLALLCTTSCNDWLDLKSYTKIINDGQGVKTLDEAGYRLNAIYSMLRAYECYGARMTYYGDACSEDMQAVGNTKRVANYYTFRFTADNSPSSFWTNFYEIINNVNLLLDGVDNLTGLSAADELTRLDYKGQALTIRALAYFDLTRLYGYPYQKDNGASWGVPVLDKPVDSDYKPRRKTVAECYTFIIDDLKAAWPIMKISKNNGKLNQWAALALLSRVYLYKGDDDNALQTAKEAIAGAESNGYQLWTNAEYKNAWATEFGSEVLWEIPMTSTENASNEAIGYLVAPKGYDDIVLSDDWTDKLMGNETNDIRYQCVINNTSDNSKSGRRYMWKYPVNSGESALYLANVKVLRLSEVYLIA
ncbi:MAG: RagB/SusD family nutrient uptake outer membrane protein, partial [Prevotellaceae bacterium]|nr:RagB/SusD family nutrient uptake outer membrane protein [Prevotellaceae bacterium]